MAPGDQPPPHEATYNMSAMPLMADDEGLGREALFSQSHHNAAPHRGRLATKASSPLRKLFGKRGASTAVLSPSLSADVVIEARRFKCSHCKNLSFVQREDVGTYITCPYCDKTCTINPCRSRSLGFVFALLGAAMLSLVIAGIILIVWLVFFSDKLTRFPKKAIGFIGGGAFAMMAGFIMFSYWYLEKPRGTLDDGFVLFQPTVDELVSMTHKNSGML